MKKLEKMELSKFKTLENLEMVKLTGGAAKPTDLKPGGTCETRKDGWQRADVNSNDCKSYIGDWKCCVPKDTAAHLVLEDLQLEYSTQFIDGSIEY